MGWTTVPGYLIDTVSAELGGHTYPPAAGIPRDQIDWNAR